MDVRIEAFQEATESFLYLARIDMAALKEKLGDERLVDGLQNGRAQKFEYTTELCRKAIKVFLKEKEGVDEAAPKKISKPTTLVDIARRRTTCCCLRPWRIEIASAIYMMRQRSTVFLRVFPAMLRCSRESVHS